MPCFRAWYGDHLLATDSPSRLWCIYEGRSFFPWTATTEGAIHGKGRQFLSRRSGPKQCLGKLMRHGNRSGGLACAEVRIPRIAGDALLLPFGRALCPRIDCGISAQ